MLYSISQQSALLRVPAFITQPHDEQEAAAVISCHRMAGQGNFDLMYPFEAQHNNP